MGTDCQQSWTERRRGEHGVQEMRVIGIGRLSSFCDEHADCRDWIANWKRDVENSTWKTPQDIKARYSTASFLPDRRVIFNVRGNNYRLEVRVAFQTQIVDVLWIGTHAQYSDRFR